MPLGNLQPHIIVERAVFAADNPATMTQEIRNDGGALSYSLDGGSTLKAFSTILTTAAVVTLAQGGTSKALTASAGGIVWSDADSMEILAGVAAANRVLLSGNLATPAWSTATYPATTTVNQLLYSSAANTVAGLATGNSGILVTSGAGVPSIATDIPTAVTIGTAYIYRVGGTDVALADGGTAASLTAAAGGLVYSGASAMAISAAGTSGYVVLSGGTGAPTFTPNLMHTQNTDTDTTAATWVIGSTTDANANILTLQFGGTNQKTLIWSPLGLNNRFEFDAALYASGGFVGSGTSLTGVGLLASANSWTAVNTFSPTTTAATSPYSGTVFNVTDNYVGTVAQVNTAIFNGPAKGGSTTITRAASAYFALPTTGTVNSAADFMGTTTIRAYASAAHNNLIVLDNNGATGWATTPGTGKQLAIVWKDHTTASIVGGIGCSWDGTYTNMFFGALYSGGYKTLDNWILAIRGSGLVGLEGTAARTFSVERHTTANTAGVALTVQAGGATSAATDKAGGVLYLKSGIATGDGGSAIEFWTVAASQGAGTTDRSPILACTIQGGGYVLPATGYKSSDGTEGMTAAVDTSVTALLTVKDGLITAVA